MIYINFLTRILLSIMLGFLIGLERQLTGHKAGIRINVLICMGTTFFTLFPIIYGSDQIFRVSSSIIAGVGFLCSSVIFKENGLVKGMNTAATLWCTAAIGILCSAGHIFLSIIAAATLIISNLILRPIAIKINPISFSNENEERYLISTVCKKKAELEIREIIINTNNYKNLLLINLESINEEEDNVRIVAEYCFVGKPKNNSLEAIVVRVLNNSEVINARWEIV